MVQIVRSVKDHVSGDGACCPAHNISMDRNPVTAYRKDLCARVKQLREAKGYTQQEVATALQVGYENYRKYEKRSPLPHYLLEPFALLVGADLHYLVTGRRLAKGTAKAGHRPLRPVQSSASHAR